MPEGDTVWLAAQRLDAAFAARPLTGSDFRVPHLATVDLGRRTILNVRSYGKHLLFPLDDGRTLHTHFRMDGSWHLYRPGRPWRGGPGWQVRAVLTNEEWVAVGFRLPVIELISSADVPRIVGRLGPDMLADMPDVATAVANVSSDPDRAIGDALLDQSLVAGFGLIYVTEGLFLHGVSPGTPVRDVPDLNRLIERTQRLMAANRTHGAQTATGNLRAQHYVYGRAGRACRRCGQRVNFGQQASGTFVRDAYWCGHCQPGPAPG